MEMAALVMGVAEEETEVEVNVLEGEEAMVGVAEEVAEEEVAEVVIDGGC